MSTSIEVCINVNGDKTHIWPTSGGFNAKKHFLESFSLKELGTIREPKEIAQVNLRLDF